MNANTFIPKSNITIAGIDSITIGVTRIAVNRRVANEVNIIGEVGRNITVTQI